MKKIVLTGGGTAGHVNPNIALLPNLKKIFEVYYIGSKNGIEKDLIQAEKIKYYGISSGKLRRYFDFKNFTDPFRVIYGYFEAMSILKKIKPDVVFSKGGFVSVPVALAAKSLNIPVVIHESDLSLGLANKICLPCAKYICCNFPETIKELKSNKAILTGSPIRQELLCPDKNMTKIFKDEKPVILVVGGSLGSAFINKIIRSSLDKLLKDFNILHICGKNNIDKNLINKQGYLQYEYVKDELKNFFDMSSIIISRAGANSISEILALKKPNILIPLSSKASRGDQILNADSYKKSGFSEALIEDKLTDTELVDMIYKVYKNRQIYIDKMKDSKQNNSIELIIEILKNVS